MKKNLIVIALFIIAVLFNVQMDVISFRPTQSWFDGYWMDITTDYFGNPRHATAPTIGAIGLSGYDY